MKARSLPAVGRLLALAALMLVVFAPVAAFAQTDYPTTPTTTAPRDREPLTVRASHVVSTTTALRDRESLTVRASHVVSPSTSGGTLPFTGGNLAVLVELGLAAVVAGVVLVRVGRRADLTR
jgi:hypothetical protein